MSPARSALLREVAARPILWLRSLALWAGGGSVAAERVLLGWAQRVRGCSPAQDVEVRRPSAPPACLDEDRLGRPVDHDV